jgi:Zn-finger nucleic acid-binding protein
MQCPTCDVTLSISSREGIEIDFCPQCRGVWLDRGELDKVIERTLASTAGAPPADRPREAPRPDDGPRYEDRPRYDDRPRPDDRSAKKRKRRSFLEDLFEFD